ncbi:MAG: hypothetical protein J6C90_00170 [Clostridia bacterium]|nr:hypothetical protein [Clostridia bacterium]
MSKKKTLSYIVKAVRYDGNRTAKEIVGVIENNPSLAERTAVELNGRNPNTFASYKAVHKKIIVAQDTADAVALVDEVLSRAYEDANENVSDYLPQ